MRILVWNPKGAGDDYGTPGKVAIKIFSRPCFNGWSFDLYHANPELSYTSGPFTNLVCQGRYNGWFNQIKFLYLAKKWIERYGKLYDAFIGMTAYTTTVYPAAWFQQHGGISIVRISGYRSDLAAKSNISGLTGFPVRRRKLINNSIGAVIAVSSSIRNELFGYGLAEKTVTIVNGVDTDYYAPLSSDNTKSTKTDARVAIIFTGSINRMKRVDWVISALGRAVEEGIDCYAYVVGPKIDAEYWLYIEQYASSLGVRDRLEMPGHVNDVNLYLKRSDIFAFPSKKEGMSNALLEAMSVGLSVVVASYEGVEDVINHEDNGLLTGDSESEFCDGVLKLARSSNLRCRLGSNARDYVIANHNLDAQAEKYKDIIIQLVSKNKCKSSRA